MSAVSDIIIFNTSKKIAQLNKVIANFQVQLTERSFLKDAYRDIYDQKNNELKKDFDEKMKLLTDTGMPNIEEITTKHQQDFDAKIVHLKIILQEQTQKIQDGSKTISEQLDILQNDLNSIVEPVKTKINSNEIEFQGYLNKTMEIMKGRVKEMKDIHRQEMNEMIEKAERKETDLVKSSQEKFEKMRKDHSEALSALRAGKPMPKLSEKDMQKLIQMKKTLAAIKDVIMPHFATVHGFSRSRFLRDQFGRKISEIRYSSPKAASISPEEIERLKEEIARSQCQIYEEEGALKSQLDSIKAQNTFQYEKLKSELYDSLENIKNMYDERNKIVEMTNTDTGKEITALKSANSAEREALKKKILGEEEELNSRVQSQQKENDKTKKQNKSERLKLKKVLTAEKNKNSAEAKEQLNKYQTEESELEKQLKDRQKQLQKDIKTIASQGSASESLQKQELDSLLNEKKQAESVLQAIIKRISDRRESLMKERNDEYAKEEEEIASDLNQIYVSKMSENESKIQKTQKECVDEEMELMKENESEYQKVIESIRMEFLKANASVEFEESQKEYSKLQEQLASIIPPKNESFANDNNLIENLSDDLEKLKVLFNNEKERIIQQFGNLTEEENERHSSETRPNSSNRNRDQVKISYRQRISEIQLSRTAEKERLADILKQMCDEHQIILRKLDKDQIEKEMREMINNLKQELIRTENNKDLEIERIKEQSKLVIKTRKEERDSLEIYMKERHKMQLSENDRLKSDFESQLQLLLNELEEAIREGSVTYNELKNNSQIALEQWMADCKAEKKSTVRDIENAKNGIEERKPCYENELLQKNEYFDRVLADLQKKYREDIVSLKNDIKNRFTDMEAKIERLGDDVRAKREQYENRGSRECDLQEISDLASKLSFITNHLKSLVSEFSEVKAMLVSREKNYNKKFGSMPKIGTMQFRPSPRGDYADH